MDNTQNEANMPVLVANALININLGAGYINRVLEALNYLVEGKEEDVKALQEKVNTDGSSNTPWENAVITLTMLLQDVMRIATETGQLEYKTLEDILPAEGDIVD